MYIYIYIYTHIGLNCSIPVIVNHICKNHNTLTTYLLHAMHVCLYNIQ